MPAMANVFDTRHLREVWLARTDRLLSSADFALDWQPEEEQSVGVVFTHLTHMSVSNDCRSTNYLSENVESPEFAPSPDSEQGHHYRIRWDRPEGVAAALQWKVSWQVQLDIIDSTSRFRKSIRGSRRGRGGAFSQMNVDSREEHVEDVDEPEAKRYRGVRYGPERKKWIAEMRLPNRLKRQVSFGDYQSEDQAARAVDVAFYHCGKQVNFGNTAEILKTQPALEGLEEEAKLRLVKDHAKWVANLAMNAPSRLACAPSVTAACFLLRKCQCSDCQPRRAADNDKKMRSVGNRPRLQEDAVNCEDPHLSTAFDLADLMYACLGISPVNVQTSLAKKQPLHLHLLQSIDPGSFMFCICARSGTSHSTVAMWVEEAHASDDDGTLEGHDHDV